MDSIVLALGGGGTRGMAHIGVIRRLEAAGYRIAAIAGTSSGAVVGAVYAAGYTPDEIEEIVLSMDQRHLFDREPGDAPSLMGLGGLRKALAPVLGNKTFNELLIPFACTAVDIKTDQEIIIKTGSVLQAVQASAAVPGILPPIHIGNMELVDGGVLDPVPVSVARWLSPTHPVVAVCLSPAPDEWSELPALPFVPSTPFPQPLIGQFSRLRIAQAFKTFARSMDITSRMLAELRLKIDKPDVLLRPDVGAYGILDNVDPRVLLCSGEKVVEDALPSIRRCFSLNNQVTRIFRSAPPPGKVIDSTEMSGDGSKA